MVLPLTVVAYLAVVAGSLAATELFRRSPASLPLTGRRVLRSVRTRTEPPAVPRPRTERTPTMHATTLVLPDRDTKPRTAGITMVIDTGLPTHYFSDLVASFSGLIDVINSAGAPHW